MEHPSSITHAAVALDEQARMGMHPGGIRLSIGLEVPEDIMRDLADVWFDVRR